MVYNKSLVQLYQIQQYRRLPNYCVLWIDRSIATQRPPNPLDLFIATQSLPNEILLSRTIGNIHMGRVLVPAVLNHAQARINYGTGTAFFSFLRAVPVPVPQLWLGIDVLVLSTYSRNVPVFAYLHGARIQYLATGRYFPSSLPILVWPEQIDLFDPKRAAAWQNRQIYPAPNLRKLKIDRFILQNQRVQ